MDNIADPSDLASKHEELYLDIAMKTKKPEGPKATGSCLWCEEETKEGKRWCDADCRDSWEKFDKGRA